MNRHHRILVLLALATTLIWALPALAQQQIDESRKVDKDATITIEVLAGRVVVETWNKGEVQITGTLDPKARELKIEGGGNRLDIEVEYPERVRDIDEGSDLRIRVPEQADVEISTVSADVNVADVRGDVDIETVSGEVVVRGQPAELDVECVSGVLDIDVQTDTATLACVSGDLKVHGVRRELECSVVSGTIAVDAGKDMTSLECEAVSGDITLSGELPGKADWNLSAHSGNITVLLSGDVNAEFEVETFSGEINDIFGHQARRTSKYTPGSELEATVGDGSATVDIEAFSGEVTVRKK
jgi:DUF4097 and DUF4098 domain-containing protein YvlB